ncbi:hypothetical protein GCM10023100_18910 [Actinocorallia cavernae]|uniref:Uncharacterized protein n=2 Tax=Actinomycetes TaxID=1760 RepID=A0ABP8SGP3_9ACTN
MGGGLPSSVRAKGQSSMSVWSASDMFVLQIRGAKAIRGTDSLPVLDTTVGSSTRSGKGNAPLRAMRADVVTPLSRTTLTPR